MTSLHGYAIQVLLKFSRSLALYGKVYAFSELHFPKISFWYGIALHCISYHFYTFSFFFCLRMPTSYIQMKLLCERHREIVCVTQFSSEKLLVNCISISIIIQTPALIRRLWLVRTWNGIRKWRKRIQDIRRWRTRWLFSLFIQFTKRKLKMCKTECQQQRMRTKRKFVFLVLSGAKGGEEEKNKEQKKTKLKKIPGIEKMLLSHIN